MAKLNQFYRGSVISITVNTSSDEEVIEAPHMYAYLDGIDLSDVANLKEVKIDAPADGEISDGNYARFSSSDGKTFVLTGKQTRQLQEGVYAVELSYGNTDSNRVIVKTNNAFTLVGSVSRFFDRNS